MKEFSYTIKDPLGIHARPAELFAKKMQGFFSEIMITRGALGCDAKKLLALMKMQVKTGETITVRISGGDEEAAIEAAKAFLTENL
jgi:phosphotransferase system HPr (HPr) family protein